MTAATDDLDALRREIDALDDRLHDLLMRRTEVVQQIAAAKQGSGEAPVFMRPGREAVVLRRLMARHHGDLPKPVVARIWRELISAYCLLQGPFSVAVHAPSKSVAYWDMARRHYGSSTAMTLHRNAHHVLSVVAARPGTIGVLPLPHTQIPYNIAIFVVLAVIFGIVLHATATGRSIYAMGASPEAALFAGIRVKRVKTMLYVVSGLVCAMAGVLWTFRLATAVQNNGLGLELDVVAIVLLGGVSIFGGKGTLAGVVLAVIAFAGLQNALLLTNFNQEATGIVIGALLLVSVFAPNAGRLRQGLPPWARGRSGRSGHQSPAVGSGT